MTCTDHDPGDEDRAVVDLRDFDRVTGLRLCTMCVDAAGTIDGASEDECGEIVRGYASYCPRHEEDVRLNRLISYGHAARESDLWREGDEQRLTAKVLGDVGIRGRAAVEKRIRRRR